MTDVTVRLPDETIARLDRLAEKLQRSPSHMAAKAIEDYVAQEEWQLGEIEAGLAEADRGDFSTAEELARVTAKYAKPPLKS